MKKSIIKNISLGIACLLGVGGAITSFFLINNIDNQTYEEARATTYDGWSHEEHGDGSSSSPYLIYTTDDLYKFRDIVNGDNGETKNVYAYANLMQDITFEGTNNWTTNFTATYQGTFQGYNHSISGLDATFENTSFGFFSTLKGTIRDLIIKDSKFIGTGTRFGVFCHTIDYSTAQVYNCYSINNTITITIENGESTNYYVGGIVGYIDSGYAQRCSNDSDITLNGTGTNFYVGGIVGYALRLSCLDCFNIGTINTNNPDAHLGGIIGGLNTATTTYCRRVFSRGHFTFPEGTMVGAIFGTTMATYTSSAYYLDDGTGIYGIGGTTSDDEEYIKRYTAEQFKDRENFYGFEFDRVWEIVNNSYPTYRNFYYVSRSWDSTNKVVVSEEKFIPQVGPVTETMNKFSNNWYVVNSNVTALDRIELYNASTVANLVLCDGYTLTANKGITVGEGQTLNIYCQSLGTGTLIASAAGSDDPTNNAGIGGANGASFSGCGTINIFGGNIIVNGVNDSYGAQIGSVSNQEGGTINIYGGAVITNPNNATTHGAGIGGSGGCAADSVNIYGGNVTARSYYGAGIGGGDTSDGCSVTINGGEVYAVGGSNAAGIGGGPSCNNGTLTINDLSVLGDNEHEPTISDTKTDYSTNRWRYMRVGIFHTHHFTYEKTNETTITAICDNEDGNCPLPEHKATLTISAPSGDLTYDGNAKEAIYVDTSNGAAFTNIIISYTKDGDVFEGNPINVGTYVATISFNEDTTKTASIEYTISKADASLTAPTGKTDLVYTGSAQELINAGSATGGTIWYKLGTDGTYTESIPTATDVGTYNVYYKVIGDANHNGIEETEPIEVTISETVASITNGTTVTYYADFSTALDNWSANTTLTLLKDVTISSSITVDSTKTLDLNGNGITASNTGYSVISVNNGGNLTIKDSGDALHYYTLTNVESNGAAFATVCNEETYNAASENARGTFQGGYITGGSTNSNDGGPYYGGGVFINTGGEATLEGGTIIGNHANNAAGGVASQGTFTMTGGNVIYNRGRRGAVLAASGTFTMTGGIIDYNTGRGTTYCGTAGGLLTYNNCTSITITGGSISHNFARYAGIDSNKIISISGNPTITDNIGCGENGNDTTRLNMRAKYGLTIDGVLTNETPIGILLNSSASGVFTYSTDTSYNDATKFVSDNTNYIVGKNADGQLLLGSPVDATYQVVNGGWVGGSTDPIVEEVASGGVPQNVPTGMIPDTGYNTGSWDINPSSTINSNTTFTYTFGNYVASITNGGNVTCYTDFATALSNWTDGTTLTLYKDVTVSSTTSINNTRTLDLNGYGIRATGNNYRFFTINSSGYLTVIDSDPAHAHAVALDHYHATSVSDGTGTTNVDDGTGTAYITGGYIGGSHSTSSSTKEGLAFYIDGGKLDLYGGAIIGNYVNVTNNCGAGVYMKNGATLKMYDGASFIYNYSQNSGAAIEAVDSYIEIYGGVIAHNRSDWGSGTAISAVGATSIKLYGGVIEDNSTKNTGAISLARNNLSADQYFGIKGSPTVTNNYSWNNNNNPANINLYTKAHIEGPLSNTEKIGVNLHSTGAGNIWTNGSGVFTEGWSTYMAGKDPADYFFSDNPNYIIYLKDGEAYCGESPAAKVQNGEAITYYENFSDALTAWTNNTTLTLLKDIETTSITSVSGTKTLDLNGYGIIQKGNYRIFKVTSTGHLTIIDSDPTHAHVITLSTFRGTDVADGTGTTAVNDNGTGIAYITGGYLTGGNVTSNADGLEGACLLVNGGSIDLYGGTIIGNYLNVTNCAGSGVGVINGGTFRMHNGTITYNYSSNSAAGIENISSYVEIYNGTISHNKNNNGGGAAISVTGTGSLKLYGGRIEGNTVKGAEGVVDLYRFDPKPAQYFGIKGSPVVQDNSTLASSGFAVNVRLYEKINIEGELTEGATIGVSLKGSGNGSGWTNGSGVFTEGWSTYMAGKDPADYFFSDNPSYHVYLKDGEAYLGSGYTVTFNTNGRGIAPDPVIVDDGSLVNKPTDPTVEGYEVKGWYKEAECENIWDFDNDTVTEDITLYALWDYDTATANVIKLINDIGTLTYDGGSNDSLDDILAAINAYDALTPGRKVIVDGVNKDILDHDVTTYRNVDKVGDLIKAIPEAKPSKDYYDAVDLAKTEYDKLTAEEVTILNTTINFEQFLNDDIAVKEVVIEIEEIGEVGNDSISQEKIQKARASYDSLSEDQKRLIAPEVLRALEEKEATYTSLNNTGNSLLVVFLIISGLLLILGLIVMYFIIRKKKEDNGDDNNDNSSNKSKTMKLASFTGLMPFIIYTSHYLEPGYIILYIIIALTVIVWLTNLVLFILKKKGLLNKKKEESKPLETVKEPEPVNEEEEEEVVTITDEKGNIFNIRYIKSFTAKLIQSPDETKKYYEELKNYVLSYKKTTSRISWHYDSINSGRNQVLKFAIRGKTLCVYYPLNASDYEESKYKVEAVDSKKFEEVPCLYRIKNDRRLGYAKDLIDTVMNNLGLVKGEEQHEVYSDLPYEPNKPLIDRGLIKELKIQVNKPVEQVVSKKVNDEGDEIVTTRDTKGNIFEIRYIKSFTAKLSQASEEVKDYYNELKNYALSYKKANSRVSWHFDSINVGRNQVIKFSIRGKTLCVYYALNANDYLDTKYKVEVVESKKFEEVPCLYRIKNDRRRDYAKDLIDTVMANVPTEKGKESSEDFRIPYESTKTLLAKGLIKENKVQVNKPVAPVVIKAEEVDVKMSDEEAASQIKEDSGSSKHIGKKGIVNIDVIAKSFANNEVVNIESLWEKKIISKNIGHVKVLARGSLDKKLHIELQDYSLQAVKMILLAGGTVKKVK